MYGFHIYSNLIYEKLDVSNCLFINKRLMTFDVYFCLYLISICLIIED